MGCLLYVMKTIVSNANDEKTYKVGDDQIELQLHNNNSMYQKYVLSQFTNSIVVTNKYFILELFI